MRDKKKIIVIGSGIVGVSTALHLQEMGEHVCLIDKGKPGQETSFGNSGNIESSYVLPFSPPDISKIPSILLGNNPSARMSFPTGLKSIPWILKFYKESKHERLIENGRNLRPLIECSVDEHKSLMKGTEAEKYLCKTGRAKLHRSESSFQAASLERDMADHYGVPYEVLDRDDFLEREPALNPVFKKAVIWTGSARLSNPGKVVEMYAKKFQERGGDLVTDEVTNISKQGEGWIISTKSGVTMNAEALVICTGPWANTLLEPLGAKMPLAFKRGYHRHYKNYKPLKYNITDADYGYVLSNMEQGLRITTGAEFADIDARPNPVQILQALPHAQELMNFGEAIEDTPWMGSRPCFADSCPAIGPLKGHKGLWVNIGHGHSGLTIGPSSGRLLAQMVTGEKTFCDPKPYSPDRF